jgi:hypothetical protein
LFGPLKVKLRLNLLRWIEKKNKRLEALAQVTLLRREATVMAAKKDDKKQDAKVMKGMTPAQKAKFQKEDKKMDKKPMSRKEDAKKDAALAKKVKGKK